MTTDFLFCFDSVDEAVAMGVMVGLTFIDPDSDEASTISSTHVTAVLVIGEHFAPTGNMIDVDDGDGGTISVPEKASDGKHWILVRTRLASIADGLPPELDEANRAYAFSALESVLVTRDPNDPAQPQHRFA